MSWKTVGVVLPQELTEARLQLHWATQLVSAPGTSLLPAEPDDSHMNLGWDHELNVLAGRPVGERAVRAALVFEGLELVILDGEREASSLLLAGRTLDQGLAWLAEELGIEREIFKSLEYEMPAHSVGEGGQFSDAGTEERIELAAWFADASSLITDIVAGDPAASPVRCWPHHFDVASLITLDPDAGAEEARSIGVGLSPGDGSYDQPYFYVTPWPYPDAEKLPPLTGGAHWHTSGWTGAVLTGDRLISVPPEDQEAEARRALDGGIAACREALEG